MIAYHSTMFKNPSPLSVWTATALRLFIDVMVIWILKDVYDQLQVPQCSADIGFQLPAQNLYACISTCIGAINVAAFYKSLVVGRLKLFA